MVKMKLVKLKRLTQSDFKNWDIFIAFFDLTVITLNTLLHSIKILFRSAMTSKCTVIILVSAQSVFNYMGAIFLLGAVTAMFMPSLCGEFKITEFYKRGWNVFPSNSN